MHTLRVVLAVIALVLAASLEWGCVDSNYRKQVFSPFDLCGPVDGKLYGYDFLRKAAIAVDSRGASEICKLPLSEMTTSACNRNSLFLVSLSLVTSKGTLATVDLKSHRLRRSISVKDHFFVPQANDDIFLIHNLDKTEILVMRLSDNVTKVIKDVLFAVAIGKNIYVKSKESKVVDVVRIDTFARTPTKLVGGPIGRFGDKLLLYSEGLVRAYDLDDGKASPAIPISPYWPSARTFAHNRYLWVWDQRSRSLRCLADGKVHVAKPGVQGFGVVVAAKDESAILLDIDMNNITVSSVSVQGSVLEVRKLGTFGSTRMRAFGATSVYFYLTVDDGLKRIALPTDMR